MSDQSDLLRASDPAREPASLNGTGLLPSQIIGEMIRNHEILSSDPVDARKYNRQVLIFALEELPTEFARVFSQALKEVCGKVCEMSLWGRLS